MEQASNTLSELRALVVVALIANLHHFMPARSRRQCEDFINRNLLGGFAPVAWPAEYGESGVMTFIVNQQGRVYQRDLGVKTTKLVRQLRAYDPDERWQISTD